LVSALEADLIGPFRRGLSGPNGEDGLDVTEELELPPSRWYLTGFLAPESGREEEEEAGEDFAAGNDQTEEEAGETAPDPKKKSFLPASIGLTVFVPAGVKTIDAVIRYATYDKVDEDPPRKDKKRKIWKRVPNPAVTETIDLTDGSLAGDGIAVRDSVGLRLQGQVKPLTGIAGLPDGTQAVSVFLVNRRAPDGPGYRDRAFVFQVEMELQCTAGFYGRPDHSGEGSSDIDLSIADLQYRDIREYGVGHGISVEVPADQTSVTRVRTTWLPRHEVRRVEARSEKGVTVGMETLAAMKSAEEIRKHLARLPAAYAEWIKDQRAVALSSAPRRGTRNALLDRAQTACARIADGIELLCSNDDAREAFCLANRAMAMAARKKRPHADPQWRLFQLAFVLLNLRGLLEPTHLDRERAELIFFPTGGGKTEAYLGVIACTLLLRRLRSQDTPHAGLGVAVILRYTLRLLTLDQLARAATLICALEVLRRDDPKRLGTERFSVGLWVGRSATSNTMAEIQKAVLHYQTGRGDNPAPLTNCPWCDTEIKPNSFALRKDGKIESKKPEEVHLGCLNDACDFCSAKHTDGIPVVFVDEQVYRELPSFLIGTVDKFAMIPWRGETGKLFGKVTGRAGRLFFNATDVAKLPKGALPLPQGALPPELIVQDELHLISGPLGTMVGLYETAIDFLSQSTQGGKTVRPKVIAATATVRRASEQMQALYTRKEVHVFPPPAVDAMDTYFSCIDKDPAHAGRLYLGVAAQGRAMKAILVRVYRAMVVAGAHAYANAGSEQARADAYTTVAGYFNSLRELGGMRRIVEDELRVRTKESEKVKPLDWVGDHPWFLNRKLDSEPVELTSRQSTEKIKKAKDRLNVTQGNPEHVDVLLASNMISVGVDIDRLGLMVVAGQPKTTAEYIQASSRVGRQADRPGLVVTCMNSHKPRDRSHYERFTHYHQAFYRFVEATSVTPFSGPALDRGLAGALVAMARFSDSTLTPPEGAMEVAKHKAQVLKAIDALVERAIGQPRQLRSEEEELKTQVRSRARNLIETWEQLVKSTEDEPVKRRYSKFDKDKSGGQPLLHQALEVNAPPRNSPEGRFCAATSMRDVEETAHLWVKKFLGQTGTPSGGGQ
jgi:hypothetical protein